jgi:thymidylate synthase (FAD)
MGTEMNDGKILVELQEHMGSDVSIANAAWTSTYDKDRREDKYDDPEKVASIVPRLIKDGHGTPIESVVMRFWIRLPIMIDRQHMTHRIASHNGLSGRYRTLPDDWFTVPQDVIDICNRITENPHNGKTHLQVGYDSICQQAFAFYNEQLRELKLKEKWGKITNAEFKRMREVIRGVLPVAGMVERTTIFNLRSFANYQRQRNSDHAQKEICQIAQLMLKEVKEAGVAPIAIKTLEEIGWRI